MGQSVTNTRERTPKTIVQATGQGYYKCQPSWRFAELRRFNGTGFGYDTAMELIEDILAKLVEFERRDWNEIVNTDRDHNHWCDVCDISKEAQDMLSQNRLDFDKLFSLRLDGKFRIWGFINDDGSFDIYWCDKEHEIYPSKKK